jgi:hypothetical protein
MKFGEAFYRSRKDRLKGDSGETFEWGGKKYHNYTKAELDEMDNAKYNEIASRLSWKERVSPDKPGKVTDTELSQYSDRTDATTMKQKQLLNELQQPAMQSSTATSTKGVGTNPQMISAYRQNRRNNDPEFMAALQDMNEEKLMYRPEKDRMEKSPELTDDMIEGVRDTAIMQLLGFGAGGLLGKIATKGLGGFRSGSYLENAVTKVPAPVYTRGSNAPELMNAGKFLEGLSKEGWAKLMSNMPSGMTERQYLTYLKQAVEETGDVNKLLQMIQ